MSSVQTVYIQYTQLKRAVNPPRKKKTAAGEADAPGGAAKKRTAFAARACGFAVPPGMLILVCRPRSQPRSAARYVCFSPAARALVGSPSCLVNRSVVPVCRPRACGFAAPPGMLILVCRPRSQPRSAARALAGSPRCPVCLFWSAARARSRAPPPGMFASALPPARLRVCRAAGYAYFGLPPALAAALRRPECLLQPCRPRSQPRSAARYVCFSLPPALAGSPRRAAGYDRFSPAAVRL